MLLCEIGPWTLPGVLYCDSYWVDIYCSVLTAKFCFLYLKNKIEKKTVVNHLVKTMIHFRYRKKKIHRFTNNLQGLQKVMVKDFSWNIIPWNALLFEKTLKQYQFSIARITNLFWTHVMTRGNVRKQGWVFPLFSPDSDDRLSLNFHRFVILYRSCDTRSVGLGQYCLPKVSNGFKQNQISQNIVDWI